MCMAPDEGSLWPQTEASNLLDALTVAVHLDFPRGVGGTTPGARQRLAFAACPKKQKCVAKKEAGGIAWSLCR